MRVGFIGLGNMGAPMASFVRQAGFPLVVHDLRRSAAAPVLDRGGVWAESPGAVAAQCDVVCVCVPGPPVGGDAAILRSVKPVLDTFSRSVVWVGELGAGSVTKIVHNALAMSIDLLIAECLTLGVKAGVAMPRLVEAFGAGCIVGQNMTFIKRMPATLFRGDFTARFALALAHKDFGLAADLARAHNVPTRLLDLCQMELQEAMNRGWGDADRLKASTLQEERAGVRLRMSDSG